MSSTMHPSMLRLGCQIQPSCPLRSCYNGVPSPVPYPRIHDCLISLPDPKTPAQARRLLPTSHFKSTRLPPEPLAPCRSRPPPWERAACLTLASGCLLGRTTDTIDKNRNQTTRHISAKSCGHIAPRDTQGGRVSLRWGSRPEVLTLVAMVACFVYLMSW